LLSSQNLSTCFVKTFLQQSKNIVWKLFFVLSKKFKPNT